MSRIKNKDKHFENEIMSRLTEFDESLIQVLFSSIEKEGLNKLSLIRLLKQIDISTYEMNDLEIR